MQRFYFQYQAEALPHGTSLQAYCLNNNVPYNIFSKWYKNTRLRSWKYRCKAYLAEMAATYHSIISTVKLHGKSVWGYLGEFFKRMCKANANELARIY